MRVLLPSAVLVLAVLIPAASASTDDGCHTDGFNRDCNELGHIAMVAAQNMSGQPVRSTAHITLSTALTERGAEWVMFTVRAADAETSPLWLKLEGLSTADGPVTVARVEQQSPQEVDAWVEASAAPIGQEIFLNVTVGSTGIGSFPVEALVMPFDALYAPMPTDEQEPVNLFSSTIIDVQRATAGPPEPEASRLVAKELPAVAPGVVAMLLLAIAFVARRRAA